MIILMFLFVFVVNSIFAANDLHVYKFSDCLAVSNEYVEYTSRPDMQITKYEVKQKKGEQRLFLAAFDKNTKGLITIDPTQNFALPHCLDYVQKIAYVKFVTKENCNDCFNGDLCFKGFEKAEVHNIPDGLDSHGTYDGVDGKVRYFKKLFIAVRKDYLDTITLSTTKEWLQANRQLWLLFIEQNIGLQLPAEDLENKVFLGDFLQIQNCAGKVAVDKDLFAYFYRAFLKKISSKDLVDLINNAAKGVWLGADEDSTEPSPLHWSYAWFVHFLHGDKIKYHNQEYLHFLNNDLNSRVFGIFESLRWQWRSRTFKIRTILLSMGFISLFLLRLMTAAKL
jgi:hypothetical protein